MVGRRWHWVVVRLESGVIGEDCESWEGEQAGKARQGKATDGWNGGRTLQLAIGGTGL